MGGQMVLAASLTTACLQLAVVLLSGSVALLAVTVHNFGDAATALPLWVAFTLRRWPPTEQFPYGYGRVEDLAGMAIILIMAGSAIVAGYEAVDRLLQPQPVAHLGAVVLASGLGFAGNEAVAWFRIKVGRAIDSAALVADGYHTGVDGWTSLAVLFGALGVWLGYPLADPLVGLLITAAIGWLVWNGGRMVVRAIDGVDPQLMHALRHATLHVPGVVAITDVQARWLGHGLRAEVSIAVASDLSVAEGHAIAKAVCHQLLDEVRALSSDRGTYPRQLACSFPFIEPFSRHTFSALQDDNRCPMWYISPPRLTAARGAAVEPTAALAQLQLGFVNQTNGAMRSSVQWSSLPIDGHAAGTGDVSSPGHHAQSHTVSDSRADSAFSPRTMSCTGRRYGWTSSRGEKYSAYFFRVLLVAAAAVLSSRTPQRPSTMLGRRCIPLMSPVSQSPITKVITHG